MPRLTPQRVGIHDWYYEYPTHLLLVHEVCDAHGKHLRTDQIKLPWRLVSVSLKRAYKPRRKKE